MCLQGQNDAIQTIRTVSTNPLLENLFYIWIREAPQMKEQAVGLHTIIWADGAALVCGNYGIRAVDCFFADHIVAHNGPAVAHADLAWLWFPYITIVVDRSIKRTAGACAWGRTEWVKTQHYTVHWLFILIDASHNNNNPNTQLFSTYKMLVLFTNYYYK